MGIFDMKLNFRDLLRSSIVNYYKEYMKEDLLFLRVDEYQVIVHNIYKSGVNPNNLNNYILWSKTNHKSKIVNIYIKFKGSHSYMEEGFPVTNKRGTDIITLDKIIEND